MFTIYMSLCLFVSLSLCFSVALSLYLSVCSLVSPYLCFSVFQSLYLSLSISVSLSQPLYLSLSHSPLPPLSFQIRNSLLQIQVWRHSHLCSKKGFILLHPKFSEILNKKYFIKRYFPNISSFWLSFFRSVKLERFLQV